MTEDNGYSVLPMDRNRRAVARSMRASASETPHVTLHRRARADALVAARRTTVANQSEDGDARVTLTVLLARIVARSLAAYPRINGRTEQGEIRTYERVNLGLAVALVDGLTVPVLHDADAIDLQRLARAVNDVIRRAREGTLKVPDLVGGTFSLTNLGPYGVEFFTPLINPPQMGILGVGALRDEVELVDGVPVSASQLYLSLSFDHAALDGATAAHFLDVVVDNIETPTQALSDEPIATSAGGA